MKFFIIVFLKKKVCPIILFMELMLKRFQNIETPQIHANILPFFKGDPLSQELIQRNIFLHKFNLISQFSMLPPQTILREKFIF